MGRITWAGALIFVLFSTRINAFIYKIQVLENSDQTIIGLSDWHDNKLPIGKTHRRQILDVAKRHKAKVKLAVEDLSSSNASGKHACTKLALSSSHGVLASLTKDCNKQNIPVENLEYRFDRVIAFGPLLHIKDPQKCLGACSITVQNITQEVQQTLQEIAHYNDSKQLNSIYKQMVSYITQQLRKLNFGQHAKDSVAQFIAKTTTQKNRNDKLKQLLTFDSGLLDCKLLHTIHNNPNTRYLVIIAGGTHVDRTCNILQRFGYTKKYASKVVMKKQNNVQQCLGAQTITSALLPQPMHLGILNRFFS